MLETLFIVSLAVIFSVVYSIAFRILPGERWQVFAAVPLYKTDEDSWHGVNITYYGLFTATGYTFALTILFVMMTSAGAETVFLFILVLCLLVLFIPSARIMAFFIERKKYTLTIGGAVFVLFFSAPWIMAGLNRITVVKGLMTGDIVFFASLVTAYAFGEGIGRLACISFGCCYGKSLSSLPPFMQKLFSKFNFVYTGKTKKISYHDHLDGVKTVPVQAITAVLYTASGLTSLWIFFKGHYYFSFFLSLIITQLWRFVSEFLRSDFRGYGRISVYQVMSIVIVPYYIIYVLLTGIPEYPRPDLLSGFRYIWSPGFIILLIGMWIGCVLYTGVSSVTSSIISIYVNEDKI